MRVFCKFPVNEVPIGLKMTVGMSPRSARNFSACGQKLGGSPPTVSTSAVRVATACTARPWRPQLGHLGYRRRFHFQLHAQLGGGVGHGFGVVGLPRVLSYDVARPAHPVALFLAAQKRCAKLGLGVGAAFTGGGGRRGCDQARPHCQGRQPDGGHEIPPAQRTTTTTGKLRMIMIMLV